MNASRMIAVALAAGALVGVPAAAQSLQDPTEPPASMLAPGGVAAPVTSGPQLQSILMAKGGTRRVAVIDGQTLRLGDSYKGALLVGMTETQVVLRRGRSDQVIKLFPSNESKSVNRRQDLAQP